MDGYQLHVILDVFSRYVPGWIVAHREGAVLTERLIEATRAKQRIAPAAHLPRGPGLLDALDAGRAPTRRLEFTRFDGRQASALTVISFAIGFGIALVLLLISGWKDRPEEVAGGR